MQIVRIVILTLCCLVFATAKAQIDTQFSQYWALPGYYNPAAAGSSDKLNILTSTRQQWIGMPGAPQTYFVTGDMPFKFLKQNHGVGLVVTSETEGLYSHLILGAQYAFKIKLWKGVLSLGIQLGMLDERFDGTQVSIPTESPLPSCKACRSICLSGHGTPIRGSMREFRSHTSTSHRSPLKTNTKHTSADPIILSPGAIFPLKTRYMKCSPP